MNKKAIENADNFIRNETQFHLGFLPIEQANPKTVHLDRVFFRSAEEGVRMLQSVDRDLLGIAQEVLSGERFAKMVDAIYRALSQKKKIVFSGCGATGRLSILLESAYRNYYNQLQKERPEVYINISDLADSVYSIMTGGDYALIRSVEFFEDHLEFGRQQVRELEIGADDVLIAITGTGETSSILGTVMEAAERRADVFLLICVPAEIPKARLDRCRSAFENPRVTVIDMPCGAMAIAGSTRMQSTTLEQLIAGGALEKAMSQTILDRLKNTRFKAEFAVPPIDYAKAFGELLDALEQSESVYAIASYIKFEEEIYCKGGLITYFADDFLLDILTDTTERSPTFILPPFRKCADRVSPQSWAFVKNPLLSTPNAWRRCLGREPRCLNWNREDYTRMGAAEFSVPAPPKLDAKELMKFIIGREVDSCRYETAENAAVMVGYRTTSLVTAFNESTRTYRRQVSLIIGEPKTPADFLIPYVGTVTPLRLLEHLAIKLVLNIISTGTMVKMGRVTGNWMTWLDISNKKLLDRGVRLIAELCGLEYREACIELFTSQEELKSVAPCTGKSPLVQYTIQRLRNKKQLAAGKGI